MKRVLVSGAGGFVGRALSLRLSNSGWEVVPLGRRDSDPSEPNTWNIPKASIRLGENMPFDAVIHLAGESIASERWTAAKKRRIRDSRIEGTRLLSEHLAGMEKKPAILLTASASGFYGDRGDEALTESSPRGTGFLAETCEVWEAATAPAAAAGIRVVHMRFGMVLSPDGGALARILPIFKLGLGGPLGGGRQFWSWIDLRDLVRAAEFCIETESIHGAVNFASPLPVTNRDFTNALAHALNRPAILPMPAFALRLAVGEMADGLLLAGARMMPGKLLDAGFEFRSPSLEAAFAHL